MFLYYSCGKQGHAYCKMLLLHQICFFFFYIYGDHKTVTNLRIYDETCLRFVDGFRIPVELALRIVVPIFKGKGDLGNWSCY